MRSMERFCRFRETSKNGFILFSHVETSKGRKIDGTTPGREVSKKANSKRQISSGVVENVFWCKKKDEKNLHKLYNPKSRKLSKERNLNIKTLFKIKEKQNATTFYVFLLFEMCSCVCFYVHVLCVFMVCSFVCSCLVLSFVIFSSIGFPVVVL